MSLPVWLTANENAELPAGGWRWGRADYLDRTLGGIQKVVAEDMYQAGIAARPGFLQSLNPRIKLAGCLLVLLAAASTRDWQALLMLHGIFLAVALASGIRPGAYLLRTWLPASLFAGIAVLPAAASWVTPGEPLLILYQNLNWSVGNWALPTELAVTRQGLTATATVFLRASASMGLMVLLVKTTRWPVITKALGGFGLPGLFIMVLDLTYRYLFLFLLLLSEYILGRKSRLVGREGADAKLVWVGGALAGFLRMAGEYGQEISAAMQARGYTGENQQVLDWNFGIRDTCFMAAVAAIIGYLWGGSQLVGGLGF